MTHSRITSHIYSSGKKKDSWNFPLCGRTFRLNFLTPRARKMVNCLGMLGGGGGGGDGEGSDWSAPTQSFLEDSYYLLPIDCVGGYAKQCLVRNLHHFSFWKHLGTNLNWPYYHTALLHRLLCSTKWKKKIGSRWRELLKICGINASALQALTYSIWRLSGIYSVYSVFLSSLAMPVSYNIMTRC